MSELPNSTTLVGLDQTRAAEVLSRETDCSPFEAEVLALFDHYHDRLVSYVLRFNRLTVPDCEEVVQEAFLALFQHLQQGRSRENLRGWLFRVVHNLGLKRVRGWRRDSQNLVTLTNAGTETVADRAPNPEDAFERDETSRRVLAVVRALPELDQRCLALRAEGLRYREIAGVLDISLGGVARSLERSLERLARAAGRKG